MLTQMNYIQNSHRMSLYNIAETVKEIYPGQFFHLNDDSEWEVADGTRRSYPTLNARYPGAGIGKQGERLEGRDNVTRTGKMACFTTNFVLGTDQYDDTKTFVVGQPVKVIAGGILAPWEAGDNPAFIRGYVTEIPTAEHKFVVIEG